MAKRGICQLKALRHYSGVSISFLSTQNPSKLLQPHLQGGFEENFSVQRIQGGKSKTAIYIHISCQNRTEMVKNA